MKILLAEDDINILNGVSEILTNEGFQTIKAQDGQEALALYKSENPDFLCLDIMMPHLNGYDLCKEIRKTNTHIPVIFLSAKNEEIDRVLGLELGADDFITKPVGMRELIARIRAVAKRCLKHDNPQEENQFLILGDLHLYPAQMRAHRHETGEEIDLSLRETKILKLLHDYKTKVVDRNMLLDHCWGEHIMPESRTVDQHISNLRKKIELDPQNPCIIKTVQGAGYRYE